MTIEEFNEYLDKIDPDHKYGIFPPPINAEKGFSILMKHFLGDDWYSVNPLHADQIRTEAIYYILEKYPRKVSFIDKIKKFLGGKKNE